MAGFSLKVQKTAVTNYLNTNASLEPSLFDPTQSPLYSFLPAVVALLALFLTPAGLPLFLRFPVLLQLLQALPKTDSQTCCVGCAQCRRFDHDRTDHRNTKDIGLKGLVTAVDLKNSMASISIGTADGVKEGMTFHVTRGNTFICDILIIEVDVEMAIGVLDLVVQQPRVGDNASTNL